MARTSRVDAKTVIKSRLVPKLSTKVQILSIDRRTSEHAKRSKAEYLVRQLLAVQIAAYVYQRVRVRSAEQVSASPGAGFYAEPSRSSHAPRLKWEPPKAKRPLKGHPFVFLQADEMERFSHREA